MKPIREIILASAEPQAGHEDGYRAELTIAADLLEFCWSVQCPHKNETIRYALE